HECCDESAYDTGRRPEIACENQYGGSDLGETNDVGSDIRAEYLKVPPDEWTVGNQGDYTFGSGGSHLVGAGPKQHRNHSEAGDQEWHVTDGDPRSQSRQSAFGFS